MCELLVRVKDQSNLLEAALDVKLLKRGAVVVVMPDGWGWSRIEKSHPDWRILKWPHETEVTASVMMSPELASVDGMDDLIHVSKPDPMLQARRFVLDLDSPELPDEFRFFLEDNSRQEWCYRIPPSLTIEALKLRVPKRENPGVIG